MPIGGKLHFKGVTKKSRKKKMREAEQPPSTATSSQLSAPSRSLDPFGGTGKIKTSGVVVMGDDTDFASEIKVGDSIVASVVDRFRNTETSEERRVNMVLGKTSINIEAPFSCDLVQLTSFFVQPKPPDAEQIRAAEEEKRRQSEEDKLSSSILTYKVLRNPGQGPWSSWKTVTERVEGMTREDMLDIRAKNKADRYCK